MSARGGERPTGRQITEVLCLGVTNRKERNEMRSKKKEKSTQRLRWEEEGGS